MRITACGVTELLAGGGGERRRRAAALRVPPAPAHLGLGMPDVVSAVACTLRGVRRLKDRLLGRRAGAAQGVGAQHCIGPSFAEAK